MIYGILSALHSRAAFRFSCTFMDDLFKPLTLGAIEIPNRILMAPLTRCRTDDRHVPSPMMAIHYAQRASAGLLIAEATMVSKGNSAFWREPGIYSEEQIHAWQRVTSAVHERNGRIVLQLWHGGRACHPDLNDGRRPVGAAAAAILGDVDTPRGRQPYVTPRALADEELPTIVEEFRVAAMNAKKAGFDGVEVHGANGFLLDQFLRSGSNTRAGEYGGSLSGRARLLLEVLGAVASVWGYDRTGLRISPLNGVNDMLDEDPVGLSRWLADKLNELRPAYLHVMRGDFRAEQQGDVLGAVRAAFAGPLIANMGYTVQEARRSVSTGEVDAVAFGKSFIGNPDLVERIRRGAVLNGANPATFYRGGAAGYIDQPTLAQQSAQS